LRLIGYMNTEKITLTRVVLQKDVKCRKCRTCNDTLAHIVGQCVYKTVQRIRRHDEIRDFVFNKLAKMKENVQIIEEALLPTQACNLKSDLVVVSQGSVHVVDITVRHEDIADLERQRSKFDKYTPLLDILVCQINIDRGRVLHIVVGTRGSMPKATFDSLREINF